MNALLRIVRRVCKKTGEETAQDTVRALDHDPILVSLLELLVLEEMFPYFLHELTAQPSEGLRRG